MRDLIAKRYLDTFADDIDREVDLYAESMGILAPSVARMLGADQALNVLQMRCSRLFRYASVRS